LRVAVKLGLLIKSNIAVGCVHWFTVLALTLFAGCSSFRLSGRIDRLDEGLTYVLPGVEGKSFLSDHVAEEIVQSGLPGAIEVHDWTSGQPIRSLEHLVRSDKTQIEAARLSQRIVSYRNAFQDQPLHLIGHSGGAAIIVLALNQLPSDVKVDRVILLSPAISPQIDMEHALASCETMWCFYSPFDFQLTVGTSVLGTIDRTFSPSAGAIGFAHESPVDNLIQIPFRASMIRDGSMGGHLGLTSRRFVRRHIVPLLVDDRMTIPNRP